LNIKLTFEEIFFGIGYKHKNILGVLYKESQPKNILNPGIRIFPDANSLVSVSNKECPLFTYLHFTHNKSC
jgi:hypothetical protein